MRESYFSMLLGKNPPVRQPVTTIMSAGTGAKTISSGYGVLERVTIHTALVGTLTLTGFKDEAGTAANYILPVGAVGTYTLGGEFATLVAQKSSASDDAKIALTWR